MSSRILYLRKFSKQSLSITQWAASFSPICYHNVILQDATAISLSQTHFMVLMKNITLYNILKTFTLIQNFMKNPTSLQVIFQYCQFSIVHVCVEITRYSVSSQFPTLWRWAMTQELLASLLSSFWIVLWNFPLSFLPMGHPECTFTVLRFAFNNFYSLEKCLLSIKTSHWALSWQRFNVWSDLAVRLAPGVWKASPHSGAL